MEEKTKEKYEDVIQHLFHSALAVDFIAQFIFELKKNPNAEISISEFYNKFLEGHSFYEHHARNENEHPNVLFTPGLLLGLFYVTIALPKEVFYNDIDKEPINEKQINDFMKEWGIHSIKGNINDKKKLFRRLRNSLAHFNFKMYDNDDNEKFITFYDENKTGKVEIKFELNGMQTFLEKCRKMWCEIKKKEDKNH